VRLGRARHHRRIPLPGRLCCDPARSTSTCCRSHEASAGGPSCACVNRYFHDRADDGHIGLPAAVPSRQSHTREPTVPSGTARKSQIAITASPIRPHQNLQIPITSHLCPAGSCLGGFRTPAPCLSLDLRGPASENLHQVHRWCACQAIPEPDLQNVAAADCSAPRWSFSRLLLLAQSGHLSARSSRPPSVESPRPVRIPEWPRCASSRPKWTLRTDGLAAVCRAASCHGASTRLRVAPPEHCKGPLWDRSLSPAWTYVKIVVLRFAGRLRTQNWVALRAEPLALHSE